jgi:KaiC/GvpD/RAD55 family RecA-like ATPase
MSDDTYIPAETERKLNEEYPKGTRHKAKLDIAMPLLGNGIPPSEVFAALRQKFPEASDNEINDVIQWCSSKSPSPSVPQKTFQRPFIRPQFQNPPETKRTPLEHAKWWLSDQSLTIDQFKLLSPMLVPEIRKYALTFALEMLYEGFENINIVCAYIEENGKAKPHGPGRILSRDKWLEYLDAKDVPESKAGAWVRPNPCADKGTGAAGSVTDSDITAWKFLLIESDVLPIETQLALFSKLKLPIAAVIMSGGISAHAWVKVDAKSADEFKESARRILAALQPFGIDQANKNASRLSRLPSARRVIGASGTGLQELLWLNPVKPAVTQADIITLENSLEIPTIDDKPFEQLVKDSIDRYSLLASNQGKIGTPIGFSEFDRDNGGLHPGQMTVIAGETNAGKSSVAINIINNVLNQGEGVALFTLEMSRDEIADLLFSINCEVDRNHFNTGAFSQEEVNNMTASVTRMKDFKLWIFDDGVMTASQIRKRILALMSEKKVKLVVVDYAQIVAPELGDNREQQVALIARTLCSTAKDAKVALIVLSQLNDEGKLRESRVIAHEAHNVFLLENKEKDRQMIIKVVKGRRIQKKNYTLRYENEFCKIGDAKLKSKIDPQDNPSLPYSD